jgi:sugar/nucleoside kinase (ribokinase family)
MWRGRQDTNGGCVNDSRDILVVGSGNAETVLDLNTELVLGQKHNVKRVELYGGSGVNYALRLTRYDGTRVLPILSIGADAIGISIRNALLDAMASTLGQEVEEARIKVFDFVADPDFFCQGLATPRSTIVTVQDKRTIFREEMRGAEHFCAFAERRLDKVQAMDRGSVRIGAVMIGHIFADRLGLSPGREGSITKTVIDRYRDKAILFANFGESQYCLGATFWEDTLPALTAFQLSIQEAREFFGGCRLDGKPSGGARPSLVEMARWFQERRITAVITLDRFGAVATYRDHEGVFFAPAFDLDRFEDSTGAGDAFGAGLVHTLCHLAPGCAGGEVSHKAFGAALRQARMWAAHACTTRGATSHCPTRQELDAFEEHLRLNGQDPADGIDCRDLASWEGIFRILDRAY